MHTKSNLYMEIIPHYNLFILFQLGLYYNIFSSIDLIIVKQCLKPKLNNK